MRRGRRAVLCKPRRCAGAQAEWGHARTVRRRGAALAEQGQVLRGLHMRRRLGPARARRQWCSRRAASTQQDARQRSAGGANACDAVAQRAPAVPALQALACCASRGSPAGTMSGSWHKRARVSRTPARRCVTTESWRGQQQRAADGPRAHALRPALCRSAHLFRREHHGLRVDIGDVAKGRPRLLAACHRLGALGGMCQC